MIDLDQLAALARANGALAEGDALALIAEVRRLRPEVEGAVATVVSLRAQLAQRENA